MSDSAVVLPVLQPLPAASKADSLFIGPFQEGVHDRSEQLPERVCVYGSKSHLIISKTSRRNRGASTWGTTYLGAVCGSAS